MSTAALLGTSPDEPLTATYSFHQTGLDGGETELTAEAPVARFVVKVRADELGPSGVLTTENALARVYGDVRVSGQAAGEESPFVSVSLGGRTGARSELQVLTRFDLSHAFEFGGDCAQPGEGTCEAELVVEVARLDEGASGGAVAVSWSLDLSSRFVLEGEEGDFAEEAPWSVEIVRE